jgi:hypothetical protein
MKVPFPARPLRTAIVVALLVSAAPSAHAFCGFFVGKADATLGNKSSQVIVARHEQKTVISMLNEYRGALAQFALVVPVPVVLQRGQINVGDRKTFERIDAFTAPRLAEYFDPDPCIPQKLRAQQLPASAPADLMFKKENARRDAALGVAVEARYTVGEYDIVILSAKESDGLETWLRVNGYRIPAGASRALKPYVQQNMKFFVARVDLAEHAKTGRAWLAPLQFAFESPKFMLPVRLGMLNADGPQDMTVYVLTKQGRVETTNYRTVRMPTDVELPSYVREDFGRTYQAIFDEQVRREKAAVFTEYFWDMGWCDPCAANPLSAEELRGAGAFWVPPEGSRGGAQPAMVTRLHLRYTRDTLPEDLAFQETADRTPWQVRYVLRTPWQGDENACPSAKPYFDQVRERQEREATTLATLTAGDLTAIRTRMNLARRDPPSKWWEALWPANK